MTFIKSLEEIKSLCRICLTRSDNMISLDEKLDSDSEGSPIILDVLERMLTIKVDENAHFPVELCPLCHGNLKIVYDLKAIYDKSQNILSKYISTLQELSTIDPKPEIDISTCSDRDENLAIDSDSCYNADEPQEVSEPKKIIKLQISFQKQNTVKVKWLEGNKFVIAKNDDITLSTCNLKCKHCNTIFQSKEQYSIHVKACKNSITCELCKTKFYTERRLRHHQKMHHGSEVTVEIKCNICGETFKNYNSRSYHKFTRHNTQGKKHTCEICGKAFFFKNSLNQHLESHTRNVSRVVCPICGKSFHYRGGLFYHMKIHRNERNYICKFCNSRFLNMASLKRHTRIHTGERPYTCSFCSKTFCSVSEVRTHERRHTGQKPHKCKYCKKSFITPYSLKLHMSSHTGSHPCDVCGKCYLNTEVLKCHMEMKHNIKEQPVKEEMAK